MSTKPNNFAPSAKAEQFVEQAFRFLEDNASSYVKDTMENLNLKANPNDPLEHHPEWHQFGIITHTRKFACHFKETAQEYLEKWNVAGKINACLDAEIDGISKRDLMYMAIPFHDLGKFAIRFFKEKKGKLSVSYNGHEALSEKLLLNDEKVQHLLHSFGLTEAQIAYMGRCVGLHYELGKTRKCAEETASGYTVAFTQSDACRKECIGYMREFPDFKIEIGLLFLCDSLAKTDVILFEETDEEIAKRDDLDDTLAAMKLNPKLVDAVRETPVNRALAQTYLLLV